MKHVPGFDFGYEHAMNCIRTTPYSLRYLAKKYKNDRKVVEIALARDGAHFTMRNDCELVALAIRTKPLALNYAGTIPRKNYDIVLQAVTMNGKALGFAAKVLRSYREIVFAAVRSNGMALKYVGEEFKRDKEIIRLAVEHGKRFLALKFVLDEDRQVMELMKLAARLHYKAFYFVPKSLKEAVIQDYMQVHGRKNCTVWLIEVNQLDYLPYSSKLPNGIHGRFE